MRQDPSESVESAALTLSGTFSSPGESPTESSSRGGVGPGSSPGCEDVIILMVVSEDLNDITTAPAELTR